MRNRIHRRSSPPIDMTALVDVAFLLLAFFLLSSHIKPMGRADISTPAAEFAKPHFAFYTAPQATISITKEGKVYLNFHDPQLRARILLRAAASRQIALSPKAVLTFAKSEDFGGSFRELLFAAGSATDHPSPLLLQTGIPIEKKNNELLSWLKWAKEEVPDLQFNIHADSDVPYPAFENVTASLQHIGIFRLNLVTNLDRDERIILR